ncbi:MAG: abortive infection family protein [Firmicutes bacterium]|nr:abortive infection family protein [Bacillota bacterium]
MDKLKRVINQYGRWSDLTIYTERIEMFQVADFSQCVENAKALLETIGKEICSSKGILLDGTSSINSVLKKAFSAIGYSGETMVTQISSSLATIGQQIGEIRNEIGTISHGRSLEELRERNNKIDNLTKEFLIDSTIIIACFLIRTFENENPRILAPEETQISYEDNADFNDFLDDIYGEFKMRDYSFPASEILYNVDYPAYINELKAFVESEEGDK